MGRTLKDIEARKISRIYFSKMSNNDKIILKISKNDKDTKISKNDKNNNLSKNMSKNDKINNFDFNNKLKLKSLIGVSPVNIPLSTSKNTTSRKLQNDKKYVQTVPLYKARLCKARFI